nr:golgin subfamily A member 6-like protein 22 isoform X2 [Drosophila kikkawai]
MNTFKVGRLGATYCWRIGSLNRHVVPSSRLFRCLQKRHYTKRYTFDDLTQSRMEAIYNSPSNIKPPRESPWRDSQATDLNDIGYESHCNDRLYMAKNLYRHSKQAYEQKRHERRLEAQKRFQKHFNSDQEKIESRKLSIMQNPADHQKRQTEIIEMNRRRWQSRPEAKREINTSGITYRPEFQKQLTSTEYSEFQRRLKNLLGRHNEAEEEDFRVKSPRAEAEEEDWRMGGPSQYSALQRRLRTLMEAEKNPEEDWRVKSPRAEAEEEDWRAKSPRAEGDVDCPPKSRRPEGDVDCPPKSPRAEGDVDCPPKSLRPQEYWRIRSRRPEAEEEDWRVKTRGEAEDLFWKLKSQRPEAEEEDWRVKSPRAEGDVDCPPKSLRPQEYWRVRSRRPEAEEEDFRIKSWRPEAEEEDWRQMRSRPTGSSLQRRLMELMEAEKKPEAEEEDLRVQNPKAEGEGKNPRPEAETKAEAEDRAWKARNLSLVFDPNQPSKSGQKKRDQDVESQYWHSWHTCPDNQEAETTVQLKPHQRRKKITIHPPSYTRGGQRRSYHQAALYPQPIEAQPEPLSNAPLMPKPLRAIPKKEKKSKPKRKRERKPVMPPRFKMTIKTRLAVTRRPTPEPSTLRRLNIPSEVAGPSFHMANLPNSFLNGCLAG